MAFLDPKKLKFWLNARLNVLLEGEAGIGKTAVILQTFREAGLKFAYFSGATLDPFIDFVGVPVKIERPDGTAYIDLIRPKHFASGDIQVLMIDEFNRTHKKVRNAVMEIIQFGTVNGDPISSDWHGVWVAVNPDNPDNDGGGYDTDRLDKAQRDRFQIQIKMPYECDEDYFMSQFGERNGKAAVQYWNELPDEQKKLVSPRRLDYAMQHWNRNGDVRDVLPATALPGRLTNILVAGPAGARLQQLFDDNNKDEARKMLADENSYNYCLKSILENRKFMGFFIPLMPKEKIAGLFSTNPDVRKFVAAEVKKSNQSGQVSPLVSPLQEIARADQNKKVASKLRDMLDEIGLPTAPTGIEEYISEKTTVGYLGELKSLAEQAMPQTAYRKVGYERLMKCSPAEMTTEAAILGIKVADKLAHSFPATMKTSYPNLVPFVNHCICSMFRGKMSAADITAELKKNGKIADYLRSTGAPTVADLEKHVKEAENPDNLTAVQRKLQTA